MTFIEISNLDAAGSDLFASADSFLTELQPTETTQIFGGWRSGGGRRNNSRRNSSCRNSSRRNSGRNCLITPPSIPVCDAIDLSSRNSRRR